jgi:hypothetical protein
MRPCENGNKSLKIFFSYKEQPIYHVILISTTYSPHQLMQYTSSSFSQLVFLLVVNAGLLSQFELGENEVSVYSDHCCKQEKK